MMRRYNQPPQVQGRFLSPVVESKGKRHYWGLRGKNYGFYTTNDEIEMEERYRQHQRMHSEYAKYMTIPHQHQQNRRINTEPVERNVMDSSERLGSSALPRQQSNPQDIDTVIKLKRSNERAQKSRQLGLSHNVQISLQPRNIKLPEIKRNSLPNGQTLDQSRFNGSREAKGNVVYYTRRDRSLNPTFCNSLAYPLPCYKYIA